MLRKTVFIFIFLPAVFWTWAPVPIAGESSVLDGPAGGGLKIDSEQHWEFSSEMWIFDFEEWEFKTEKVKLPARWGKIVSRKSSPEYEQGHAYYNEGFLVEEGRAVDVMSAVETFSDELGEVLVRPSWEGLRNALLRSRAKLRVPNNRYLRLILYRGRVSFQTRQFIPISQSNSYRLSGRVRMRNLEGHPVKVWLSILWFKDADARSICRHANGSPAIFNTTAVDGDTGGWRELRLLFNRVPVGAHYARIRVSFAGNPIEAEADFDDIVLMQEPQVIVGFDRKPALFFADEPAVLRAELAGLPPADYRESITIEDISRGTPEEITILRSDITISENPEEIEKKFTFLPAIRNGVYRLTYRLFFADRRTQMPVAERTVAFARASRAIPLRERGRYGTSFDFFANPYGSVADFVKLIGASPLKTTLWADYTADEEQLDLFERMLKRLRRSSVMAVGVLKPLESSVAADKGLGDTGSAYAFFIQPDKKSEKALYDFIKNETSRWADLLWYLQLGEDGDSSLVDTGMHTRVEDELRRHLIKPLNNARMVLPLSRKTKEGLPEGKNYLGLYVQGSVDPAALDERLKNLGGNYDRLWVTIAPKRIESPEEVTGQVADIVRKIVICRMNGVKSVLVPLIGRQSTLLNLMEYPDETLEVQSIVPAYLNVASVLEMSTFHGIIRRGDVTAYLFKKKDRFVAMLVSPEPGTSFRVFWGNELVRYDIMGNAGHLKSSKGQTIIKNIGPVPEFIDNIDIGVAETWHSVRIEKPEITSKVSPQVITLKVKNNFNRPITGIVRLEFPPEVRHLLTKHQPLPFELKPGEEWDSADMYQLSPRVSDSLGFKEFEAVASLKVEGQTHQLRKKLRVKLISDRLALDFTGISTDDNGEVILNLKVTNNSAGRASVNLYIKAGDDEKLNRQVTIMRLAPGKAYHAEVFLPFKPDSSPGRIWVGLRELNGRQFANIHITEEEIRELTAK